MTIMALGTELTSSSVAIKMYSIPSTHCRCLTADVVSATTVRSPNPRFVEVLVTWYCMQDARLRNVQCSCNVHGASKAYPSHKMHGGVSPICVPHIEQGRAIHSESQCGGYSVNSVLQVNMNCSTDAGWTKSWWSTEPSTVTGSLPGSSILSCKSKLHV